MSDDNRVGPSKAVPSKANSSEVESIDQEVIIQPVSVKELQNVRRDYSPHANESLTACFADAGILGLIP